MPQGYDYIDSAGIPTKEVIGDDMALGIGGSLALAGASSALDFAGSSFLQDDAQKFNEIQARNSRSFIREQMLNKHQWQAQDLERAGLNRILSLGGAALGGTATAQSGMNNASLNLASNYARQREVQEQNKLRRQQVDQSNATENREKAMAKLYKEQASSAKSKAELDKMTLEFIKKYPDLKAVKVATDHAGGPAGLAAVLGAGAIRKGLQSVSKNVGKDGKKQQLFFDKFFKSY